MPTFQNAFISYGRADSKAFAARLHQRLVAAGLTVWFDFEDIPLGVDYQKQIDDGIEKADNFLFLISPHSVNSPYCGLEVELALKRGKRIIPLLHVEQISWETWQERNPEGTDAQWAEYQAAGKHSSFPNMHPAIGKINWVYFREGIDDFDAALQGLLAICDRHQDYVRQHTELLAAALHWEKHQQRSQFLLTGQARQQAHTWLATRFTDEQPPCVPTDLHCEFITESIKNANNLMTQVFLCHAESDRDSAEQIRRSLMRQGITVWNYRTDIQTSQNYHSAITQGIETADNVLFMLSPASAQSEYCQRELQQALDLHKRIIPILTQPTDPAQVPESLKSLQQIDLTDNLNESDYLADESELLKILNTDAAYYTEHKTWLSQALKWQRQQQNPTMLLRGYNLRRAENWLKVARTHRYPPIELQQTFIAESLRQPPNPSLDVFISYSRVDSDFARRLNETLQIQGKRTWFDQESIASGTDFQQEIYRGIESSDVFLFVLSPQSINSPYCADEVEYANGLNKRIVTVLHRPIDTADLHPILAKLQWLDFRDHDGDFQVNFQHLLHTLDTDREHLEVHTRLLLRAGEWDRKGRDESLLLRGQELATASAWLVTNAEVEPLPTGLQQEYVRASTARQAAQDAAEKKLRRGAAIGAMTAVAGIIIAVGAGLVAQARLAEAEKTIQMAKTATRLEQAGTAALNRAGFEPVAALRKALEAGTALNEIVVQEELQATSDYPAASPLLALQQIKSQIAQERLLAHQSAVFSAAFSPDGTHVTTASFDGTARVWEAMTGNAIATLTGHEGAVFSAEFSPDGTHIATASDDGTARVWEVTTGNAIATLTGHEGAVFSAEFSPDGTHITTASDDGTARVWEATTGNAIATLTGHEGGVFSAEFSPDGTYIVTASDDGTAWVWEAATGNAMTTLTGHAGGIRSAAFSPDGTQIVTASLDGTARVWEATTGNVMTTLTGHEGVVWSAAFSPDGTQIVTASLDGTARVWEAATGNAMATLVGHESPFLSTEFSPDGTQVVTASFSGMTRVWDAVTGQEISVLAGVGAVTSTEFSPDGTYIVTASDDGTVRVWEATTGNAMTTLTGDEGAVTSAEFSPDGTYIVTTSDDGTARVWEAATGNAMATLTGHEGGIISAKFNPDGTQVVTASDDGTARVWEATTGKAMATLTGHEGAVWSAGFSPDGTQVVTASYSGMTRVWDATTGKAMATLTGHEEAVRSTEFSPDGTYIVTASNDGTARVWEATTGKAVATLTEHDSNVNSAAFSPDGTQVVTASNDGTVRVWNAKTGKSVATLTGHNGGVTSAAFSPDGTQVVTASDDRTVRVWDTATGQTLAVSAGHENRVTSAEFSPDGTYVVTASADRTIRVWDLQGRQLAIYEGKLAVMSPDGQRVATVVNGRVQTYDIETLPELIDWGCEWLHNYLEYGKATDADRAICNLPPREDEAMAPTSMLDRTLPWVRAAFHLLG
ncbi:toll/interleukin-1 receptor domain-containing protein [Leptolyngbya iicbica]|uniref:TIR domain-containing protein n=2 Tax=Cyanophyceae TaxID=3028117 RepID=A0A4Q7E2P9_9CYAN|nr:TIR domain-containing protein [Leptolyngbya sp. LK]RZM75465.1 TIR domain-containing protein [Leptolyngbya sp. LK]